MHNTKCYNVFVNKHAAHAIKITNYVKHVAQVNTVAQLLANNAIAANKNCYLHISNKQLTLVSVCEQYANTMYFNTNKSMCKVLNALVKTKFTHNMHTLCANAYKNKHVYKFAQKHCCDLL